MSDDLDLFKKVDEIESRNSISKINFPKVMLKTIKMENFTEKNYKEKSSEDSGKIKPKVNYLDD